MSWKNSLYEILSSVQAGWRGDEMSLGDNHFDISRLLLAFEDNGIQVVISDSKADEAVPRNKFGKPTGDQNTVIITIVVNKAELDISAVIAGGKPKEVLEFYALPGTINENDELTWNGHTFRTSSTWPFGLGGQQQLMFCKAEREVDR